MAEEAASTVAVLPWVAADSAVVASMVDLVLRSEAED